jgi:cbb3-type cytochrome oxidase maturation protein
MTALFVLVIISLLIAVTFLVAFIWSVRTNQFKDQKGSAMRMLLDKEVK